MMRRSPSACRRWTRRLPRPSPGSAARDPCQRALHNRQIHLEIGVVVGSVRILDVSVGHVQIAPDRIVHQHCRGRCRLLIELGEQGRVGGIGCESRQVTVHGCRQVRGLYMMFSRSPKSCRLYMSRRGASGCAVGPRSPTSIRVRNVVVPGSRRDNETDDEPRPESMCSPAIPAAVPGWSLRRQPDNVCDVHEQAGELGAAYWRRVIVPAITYLHLQLGTSRQVSHRTRRRCGLGSSSSGGWD
jgi:hypothetical protein